MVIYIINSIIPFLMLVISSSIHSNQTKKGKDRRDITFFIMMVIWFSVIATFENVWGIEGRDYEKFRYHTYIAATKSWNQIYEIFISHPITSEIGATLLDKIAGSIINNYDVYRLFLVSFIVFSYFSFFKRYCSNWIFACWMWVVWGNYRFINNTTYQMFSSAIVLLFGSKYIYDKKFAKYALVCLLASLFHASSLYYVIYYFIFCFDWKKIGRRIAFVLVPFLLISTPAIIAFLSRILPQYSHYSIKGSWYTWKIMLIPVSATIIIAITINLLRLKQKYPIGIWTQILLSWMTFYSFSIINAIAIRFTYIPEACSISIFGTCVNEYNSRNKTVIYLVTLVACIFITVYLR